MGLDMYLTKKIFVGAEYDHRKVTGTIDISVGEKKLHINFNKVSSIEESAGYWIKANAIHNWFVQNVQNGDGGQKDSYVSREDLQNLLDICKKVLQGSKLVDGKVINGYTFTKGKETPNLEEGKVIENTTVAEELLPTVSGFFFGSTEYDQRYLQDVEETIKICEEALKDQDNNDFYYHASW